MTGVRQQPQGEEVHRPEAVPARGDRYNVRSVQRALEIVEIVASGPSDGLSLSVIASRLGASKSTTLATALTLAAHGLLRVVEPGPRYKLGTELIRYGDLAAHQSPVGELCLGVVREASSLTGLTARLALAEDGYPVCVERVDGPGPVFFRAQLGRREPPHATAAGKSVLAMSTVSRVVEICRETGLPRYTTHTIADVPTLLDDLVIVRQRGYAVDDEEEVTGVFCVGAPFVDRDMHCAGAISVSGIRKDLPDSRVADLGRLLRRLADEASLVLGGPRFEQIPESIGIGRAARDSHEDGVGLH